MSLYKWIPFDGTNYIAALLDFTGVNSTLAIVNIGVTDEYCDPVSACNLTCNNEMCRYDW